MKFEWIVALRFLREGKTQTALIIGGATIGVGLIIFITGMLAGLQRDLIRRTLGTQAHIVISPTEEINRPQFPVTDVALPTVQARAQRLRSIDQWQQLVTTVETIPEMTALSPTASGPAFAVRGEAVKSVTLTGVEPERFVRVTKFNEKIVAGELRLNAGDVVIGVQLAQDLGVGLGDKIRLQTARSQGDAFTVRGLFDQGNREANRRTAYINLRAAQTLHDLVGGVSSLDIAVADVFEAETVAQAIQARTNQKVESWIKSSQQLFTAIANQNFMTRIIRSFVALIVAVGITSVLVVSVVQKQKEIGILRAMGASRGSILRVFLLQGAIIGVLGALLGSIAGTGLMALGSRVLLGPDGAPLFTLQFNPQLYASAVAVALVFGLLAAVLPARRAAGLDPAQAIRV